MKTPHIAAGFWLIKRRLTLLALVVVLSGAGAGAQPVEKSGSVAEASTISGRVQNKVSGQNLTNARIAVLRTDQLAFTDDSGRYRLKDVPAGKVVLQVYYTGLDSQEVIITVTPGQEVIRDFELTSETRYGKNESLYTLDPFVVTGSRATDRGDLAVNEQRFAANLKNVVATDAFGDIREGNVAEFLQFMPGISVTYEGDMPTTISVRGFPVSMTMVSVDGAQLANATATGGSRVFQFKQVSLNDTSRIEVTKVPTPANPASSLSGSINLVSKSAFERERAQFNYNFYLSGNFRAPLTLGATPHVNNELTRKILPAVNFDYTLPINKNLGIILTGLTSTQYNANSYDTMIWNAAGTSTGASPAAPYLQQYSIVDFPGYRTRYSLSLKIDWRPTPNSILSASGSSTYYQDFGGNNTIAFNAGTNGTPTPATGSRFSYGPDFTIGATGRGGVTMSNNHGHISGQANRGNLNYRIDQGDWHFDADLNYSKSRTWRRYLSWDTFRGLTTSMANPVRVEFHDISPARPGSVQVFDNNNQVVDYHDPTNFRVTAAVANSTGDIHETIRSGSFNLRRQFGTFSFPFSVQTGSIQQVQIRDKRLENPTWTYNGMNGNNSAVPFLATDYSNYKVYPGVGKVPWLSPEVAYGFSQNDPRLFTKTTAQMVTEANAHITNSELIKEFTEAYYLQADARLLKNRLRVLTGIRFENTRDDGRGPLIQPENVYVRNPNGTFAHTGAGARIRKPEAGAVGSMQELALTSTERGTAASRSYTGHYPSLHVTYNATEKFLVRAAYAKTYGRPDFDSVIPNTVITEFDDINGNPSAAGGTLVVRNTGLKPWSADNYDLSLEYYTKAGGVISGGIFLKEIKNFFGDVVGIASQSDLDALGLDSRYLGWNLTTKFNAGDARVSGSEFNIRQPLRELGIWGRPFEVFFNATKLDLDGDRDADFDSFVPFTMNSGITFTRKPVKFMANWNHRGRQKVLSFPAAGTDGAEYYAPRNTLDVSAEYQLRKWLSFYVNVRNILHVKALYQRYASETPEYAYPNRTEDYGVKFSIGAKGTF